mmetsp:Transcript_19759/g.48315  ORF Transcript_19759/g.48315 Transcript_19759/m.48315 type:complete len:150 (-) Transcript_19759:390-839(-)|eukprot:CAMPEP_0114504984 /NCGR_PEP_ID=MMETSP0109-20121206/10591_1 /TAXON_ID=29199 /ORGANISM="Chlorarachnion reptans, Strain CCCM449" /LENGTH=149 /DNA_ID=CAMNT_0001683353 /DNA_START=367 /DNA_END=816 /DNA_ORIENTATION=+
MKLTTVALYANLAMNVVLVLALLVAASEPSTLGAAPQVRSANRIQRVARPAMNMAKNAGMAAAVGGIAMMNQQPVQAFEAYQRPQLLQEQAYGRQMPMEVQTPQIYAQTAEVTPSLKRYFLSLLAGGGVVAAIFGALSAVAKFDQIERS